MRYTLHATKAGGQQRHQTALKSQSAHSATGTQDCQKGTQKGGGQQHGHASQAREGSTEPDKEAGRQADTHRH